MTLHDYSLIIADQARPLEFRAGSAVEALTLAKGLVAPGCLMMLMEDGKALGQMSYSADGLWTVARS